MHKQRVRCYTAVQMEYGQPLAVDYIVGRELDNPRRSRQLNSPHTLVTHVEERQEVNRVNA